MNKLPYKLITRHEINNQRSRLNTKEKVLKDKLTEIIISEGCSYVEMNEVLRLIDREQLYIAIHKS
ncbi:hypothetical protein [Staphylococcus shinii]|uniref:hypothetical protein n=1 Tax=Staphylococcus shinii TaxID=2912228 RepID=UPI003F55C7AF